jgi:uncharacterized protein (TIGR02687 family)
MLKDKIHDYFHRYPSLKVLFFFDEDQEYKEEVNALELGEIKKATFGNNAFTLKWKLVSEWKQEKVFLYLPMAYPASQQDYQSFPLLGLLVANKALQLDDVGTFMEEFGLQRHHKSLASKYMKELKYAGVQEVCKAVLSPGIFEEPKLQRGLVSAFLKFKDIESWGILSAKLLLLGVEAEEKQLQRVVKKMQGIGIEEEVCRQINRVIGLPISALTAESLGKLARGVLYNKITQGLELDKKSDPYAVLKLSDSEQITRLNQMLNEVERSAFYKDFERLMQDMSRDIRGATLVDVYGSGAPFAEYTTDMVWKIIASEIAQLTESPAKFIKHLEKISLQENLPVAIRTVMEYLVQVSKLHGHIKSVASYIFNRPENYVEYYTTHGYKVDHSYRKAVKLFKTIDHTNTSSGVDVEQVHAVLNRAYEKHTDELNREWLKCLKQFEFDYSGLAVPKQYDFYTTEIEHVDQKVVVIISDALRFEAAQELLSEMHGDAKNTAMMQYMLASIPSKTNIGMSQLLPGRKEFNLGDIQVEGLSGSGTENRSAILKKANSDSLAIQFSELEGMNQDAKREIFKTSLVYVYHDVIDATGDKRPSERRTFDVVEDAINELKRFVKTLHATMNVSKVLITADHGFLYNDREIEEKDKENMPGTDALQTHNRYVLTDSKQEIELGYSFPLKSTTCFTEDLWVNIPYSVNRYKKQGVGHQFVHGGGALQEVVVPLIVSSRQREDVKQKVTPLILNRERLKIVSNILKVNLIQEEEVGRRVKERTVVMGLYKDAKLVSNEETIVFNFTAESPSERMVRKDLILLPEASTESFLKLKVFDTDDLLNPLIEERVQNSTLIQQDF